MTCADTSSMVAYMQGEQGPDVRMVDRALADYSLVLAPVSVTELLSGPLVTASLQNFILGIQRLEIKAGYWERAGKLRAMLMRHGYRPKIADTLISQSCLDHGVPLVTRDRDFLSFQKFAGLRVLAIGDLLQ